MGRRPDIGYFDQGRDLTARETYFPEGSLYGVLPNLSYHSLAFSYLEDEAIWTRDWVCVGSVDDVPNAGDLMSFTVGNHGIHIQRMLDGSLEGRFNSAQHGGCRVVPLQCQTGTKTKCSFTSCGYSRDRDAIPAGPDSTAVAAMHQYTGLRPERLMTVQVSVVGRLVFANLDPTQAIAAAPVDGASTLAALFSADLTRQSYDWVEHPANWKLMAESLISCADEGVYAFWHLPNVVALTFPLGVAVIILQPVALERSLCRVNVFGVAEDVSAEIVPAIQQLVSRAGMLASASQMASKPAVGQADRDWARHPPTTGHQQIIRRILSMPKSESPLAMMQPLKNYLI